MIATITKMPPEKSSKPLHKAFKSFHKQACFSKMGLLEIKILG